MTIAIGHDNSRVMAIAIAMATMGCSDDGGLGADGDAGSTGGAPTTATTTVSASGDGGSGSTDPGDGPTQGMDSTGDTDSADSTDSTGDTDSAGDNDATDWVSYVGHTDTEQIRDVAVDGQGNIYVAGGTASPQFPTTAGAYDTTHNGWFDVFVMKLAPDGTLLWSTLLGGNQYERAYALELDADGNVYVGGRAGPGYPTTPGVVQPAFGGDNSPSAAYGAQDPFITKLSPDGSTVLWSTFLGTTEGEIARDFAVDALGDVHVAVTGMTASYPHITPGVFQPNNAGGMDGAVVKLAGADGTLRWASWLGGSGTDGGTPSIRADQDGNSYVLTHTDSDDAPATAGAFQTSRGGGIDLFVSKIVADGSAIEWATYVGGSAVEFTETHSLALAPNGEVVVAATTRSPDLATTPGVFQPSYGGGGGGGSGMGTNYNGDAFVWRLSADGSTLVAGTYFGGSAGEGGEGVSVDVDGNIYFTGATWSDDLVTTADAYQAGLGGQSDQFAAILSADLTTLRYSTYLGGPNRDHARSSTIDAQGNFYPVGESFGPGMPTTLDAFQLDHAGGTMDGTVARIRNPWAP